MLPKIFEESLMNKAEKLYFLVIILPTSTCVTKMLACKPFLIACSSGLPMGFLPLPKISAKRDSFTWVNIQIKYEKMSQENTVKISLPIKSSRFAASFRRISRLGSAFSGCDDSHLHTLVFKWPVSTSATQVNLSANFYSKSILRRTTHPQSWNLFQ